MHEIWGMAALWIGLALIATLLSIWFRIATALSEIVVGTVAQLIIGAFIGASLGADAPWIKFLSGTGAIVLTFLAGTELDPVVFKAKLGEVTFIGFISFLAPFSLKTLIFVGISAVVLFILPSLTPWFFKKYGDRPSELEAKYLLFFLFGLGSLAVWSESEAVLPAYIIGMVLAGSVGKDHVLIRRLRTLTFGFLTPFYFIRAGSYVSIQAVLSSPYAIFVLFCGKMLTKVVGVYPATKICKYAQKEGIYTTLLMSTGLTFGSISALFGLSHNIIDQQQYSVLVFVVIGSAVVPTLIANAFFIPHYLLPTKDRKLSGENVSRQ
jgi:Kef-type K+ transport system membrane component KefB